MSGHPEVVGYLSSLIEGEGTLSFSEFMRECLYHPQYGYYLCGESHVGRCGDFYTSVSVGAVFAQLIGRQFEEMWRVLGDPDTLVLIEQGANTGQFAVDVLNWLRQSRPELYQRVAYWFVEPHPSLRSLQEKMVARHGHGPHARWVDSVGRLEGAARSGIFFSNELIDSFPTCLVKFDQGVWKERRVGLSGSGGKIFIFKDEAIGQGALLSEIERWKIPKIENYTTEVNLQVAPWVREVGSVLRRGFVVTVDYGYPAGLLYDVNRREGTLTCYRGHKKNYDPLVEVGEQDITAHVNFDLLVEEGGEAGLRKEGLVDQHHFMVGVAKGDYLAFQEEQIRKNPDDPRVQSSLRAFRSLMHPEMMGTTFKFLIQSQGISEVPSLMGLR